MAVEPNPTSQIRRAKSVESGRPDCCGTGAVGFGDQGIIGDVDPFAVDLHAVVTLARSPVDILTLQLPLLAPVRPVGQQRGRWVERCCRRSRELRGSDALARARPSGQIGSLHPCVLQSWNRRIVHAVRCEAHAKPTRNRPGFAAHAYPCLYEVFK